MTSSTASLALSFPVGSRVELHPALDLWMMGARFGVVTKVGRTKVHVKLDRVSGVRTFVPSHLSRV